MRVLSIIIISLVLFSCANKEVKIPTLAMKGIQEVHDHSQVWIFLKVEKNDTVANINRKNTISSTHWIYNIDKRLPLYSFISSIKELKDKHANSMHSEKGKHDYFSYSDTISKKLSFLEFDSIEFIEDSILSKDYVREHGEAYNQYYNINLTINQNNAWINDAKIEKSELESVLLDFIEFSSEGKKTMLHLNFNNTLNYQQYLSFKSLVQSLERPGIISNHKEFIFDPIKVPDCGCE